jgi:hypothetical protein
MYREVSPMAYRRTYAGVRTYSIFFLIYVLIGIFVAFDRGYITVSLLKALLSALLAIFLGWLVLLGVDLHVR